MLQFPKTQKEKPLRGHWCLVYTGDRTLSPTGHLIAQYDGQFWTNELGLIIEKPIQCWAYLEEPKWK